jgi:predicted ATPase
VLVALDVRAGAAPGERTAPLDRLTAVLRPRQMLLVLDNCEHVVEHVAELADRLLRAVPGLRVLATSREPLALAGEVVWGVPPLDVPAAGADPEALVDSSAVQLFVARAAAAAKGFRLDADTAAPVAVLCRRLDGIPLALELAATRVRTLGVDGVVARLDDRFRLLAAGHRGAPPRQQTLQAMIDWSWELLTAPEQTLLRRLAVHADGATADAAAVVGSDAELPVADVPDLLARLVDRSLVDLAPGGRHRLLESVAEYSLERLHAAGETAVLRHRHADHYLALAVAAAEELHGPRQPHALRVLDAEAANLRAALATLSQGPAPGPDPERALRLGTTLAWYWVLRGRLGEARRALDAALAAEGQAPAGLRAAALGWRAGVALLRGDPDGYPEHAVAVRAVDSIDDVVTRARVTWFLAETGAISDLAGTRELLDRALADGRGGDRWTEATALITQARLAHVRADTHALEHAAERAAELFADIGDRWGQMQANCWLGGLAELVADHERAVALHQEGLRWAEELGLWPEVATRLSWLGWLASQDADDVRATAYAERALALATEQGVLDGQVFARIVLGYAARQGGRLDAAERHLRTVLAVTPPEAGLAPHVSMVLSELGFVAELRGDPVAAARLHGEAFATAREISAPRDAGLALEGLAGALAAAGEHTVAATVLGAAAAARAGTGLPMSTTERADVERTTTAARAALGDSAFAAAHGEGERLTPDEARARAEDALPVGAHH